MILVTTQLLNTGAQGKDGQADQPEYPASRRRTLDGSGFERSSTFRLCAGCSRPAAGASAVSPSFRFGADGLNTIAVRFRRSGGASLAAAASWRRCVDTVSADDIVKTTH
jgi:hypothetical protein